MSSVKNDYWQGSQPERSWQPWHVNAVLEDHPPRSRPDRWFAVALACAFVGAWSLIVLSLGAFLERVWG